MKALIIAVYVSMALVFITGVMGVINYVKADKAMKFFVGEKVVLSGDTLTIIDYSLFKETFKLEDGKEIHYSIIKKNIVIE